MLNSASSTRGSRPPRASRPTPGWKLILEDGAQAHLVGERLCRLRQAERFDEAQIMDGAERRRARFHQLLQVQIVLFDQQFIAPIGIMRPQAAGSCT